MIRVEQRGSNGKNKSWEGRRRNERIEGKPKMIGDE